MTIELVFKTVMYEHFRLMDFESAYKINKNLNLFYYTLTLSNCAIKIFQNCANL